MNILRIIPLAMTVICCLSRAQAADNVATFSELPERDELQMAFTTSGCFHYASYELTFRRSTEFAVTVVKMEGEWSRDLKTLNSTNRVTLGELTLTNADLKGLDHLLRFYRSGPRDGCTTVDKISISQHHDDKVIAAEQFMDGSCSYDRKNMTRIRELIARLAKKK